MATKGSPAARAQAAAVLRKRREADASSELVSIWRGWLRRACPEYTASIVDLPDEAFRPTGDVAYNGSFGQDPAEVRKLFLELLEADERPEE